MDLMPQFCGSFAVILNLVNEPLRPASQGQ